MTRKKVLCPHCAEQVNTLRGCGAMIGVMAEHYAMAFVIGARAEGQTDAQIEAMVRTLLTVDGLAPPINLVDVEASGVVSAVPNDAIDAFVLSLGDQLA